VVILDINCAEIIKHTARLERMGRSDLPIVIRQTLNSGAFDVKKNTMPISSDRFIHRKKTFFVANSRVETAKGFDVNSMKAIVGFIPKQGDRSHSVEDLQEQEHGGPISNRSFIALAQARASGRWDRLIRNEAFMQRILPHIVDSAKSQGSSNAVKFTKACVHAGVGGFVLGNKLTPKGNKILFLVEGLMRVGGNITVQARPLFAVKKNRLVTPKATHFMEIASVQSAAKLNMYFKQLAEARMAKK
jgi:hypothetical protein